MISAGLVLNFTRFRHRVGCFHRFLCGGLVGFLTVILGIDASAQAPYRLEVLSPTTYPQIADSWLFDLNDHGEATGYVQAKASGEYSPVIFGNGALTTLPVPMGANPRPDVTQFWFPGLAENYGSLINDQRQVVGYFIADPSNSSVGTGAGPINVSAGWLTSTGPQAFPFRLETPMTLLDAGEFGLDPTAPNLNLFDFRPARAMALNNAGQIVASAATGNPLTQFKAVLLDGANSIDLTWLDPLYTTKTNYFAIPLSTPGLSDTGKFVLELEIFRDGSSSLEFYLADLQTQKYVLMANSNPTVLSIVNDVDRTGVPWGYSASFEGDRPRIVELLTWNSDGTIDDRISVPANFGETFARNSLGQFMATSSDGPILFDGGAWKPISIPGWSTSSMSIYSFNDRGQFVGLVQEGDLALGFVASPVPEPTSHLVWLIGSTVLLTARRRGRRTIA